MNAEVIQFPRKLRLVSDNRRAEWRPKKRQEHEARVVAQEDGDLPPAA